MGGGGAVAPTGLLLGTRTGPMVAPAAILFLVFAVAFGAGRQIRQLARAEPGSLPAGLRVLLLLIRLGLANRDGRPRTGRPACQTRQT